MYCHVMGHHRPLMAPAGGLGVVRAAGGFLAAGACGRRRFNVDSGKRVLQVEQTAMGEQKTAQCQTCVRPVSDQTRRNAHSTGKPSTRSQCR